MPEDKRLQKLQTEWVDRQKKKADKSFMNLGFGTIAYFDIHFQLAVIFAIMLLISIPSLYLFAFYVNGNRHYDGLLHSIMIGNLGFSDTKCKDTALAVDRLNIVCSTGKIGRIVSFGIIPSDASVLDACLPNDETRQCEGVYNEPYVRNQLELS